MEELIKQMKEYFELLDYSKDQKIKWDKGYYWSGDKKLNEKEKYFVKNVCRHEKDIYKKLKQNPDSMDAIYLVSLLGWSKNTKQFIKFAPRLLSVKNHKLHNYVLRALFPILVCGHEKVKLEILLNVLKHKSPYCKNKVLGILSFMPLTKSDLNKLREIISDIKKYTHSKHKIVSGLAEILLNKL